MIDKGGDREGERESERIGGGWRFIDQRILDFKLMFLGAKYLNSIQGSLHQLINYVLMAIAINRIAGRGYIVIMYSLACDLYKWPNGSYTLSVMYQDLMSS